MLRRQTGMSVFGAFFMWKHLVLQPPCGTLSVVLNRLQEDIIGGRELHHD